MPVSSVRGSLSLTSTPPEGIVNEYVDGDLPVVTTPEDRLRRTDVFNDATTHNLVQNLDFNGDIVRRLQSFVSGYPVTVTYYRRHVPDQNNQSGDTENAAPSVHLSMDRINDFQMKFSQSLQFAHVTDDNFSAVTGNAITYPGWTPRVGDFFLYALPDGRVGKFDITSAQPLSIALSTCYSIDLSLVDIVDSADIVGYEEDVTSVFFFNLQTGDGQQATLLHTDEQVLLNDVVLASDRLMRYYVETFFDPITYHSFVRPDGYYDPYVVQFLSKFISYEYLHERPQQLLRIVANYNKSYWYFLENPTETYRNRVYGSYTLVQCTYGPRDSHITALLNRYYVQLTTTGATGASTYLNEGLATLGEGETDGDFASVVRLYLEQNKYNPTLLLTLADSYGDLSDEEQFYQIPVLIYLLYGLKIVLQSGVSHNHLLTAAPYAPTRFAFTSTNLSEGNILVTRIFTSADGQPLNVLGVLDNTGVQHLFEDGEIVYNTEAIHVHLADLMTRLNLTEITGTWTLVLTGVT